ncbi:PREDICTED: uncharacterized protein LOC105460782 [Wasmannia auropunctata]|uniref:uncharacterized protein LOC105460782 n=1 Tax=Wasmannia auropunctata TaxID=64793 RepID=UPI0005EDDE95|nr:PREDICTED: uncharacterized protein LOC105460782 [Wasmannia auropunctata]
MLNTIICRHCGIATFFAIGLTKRRSQVNIQVKLTHQIEHEQVIEMALNTSSWLNQCFVEKILRKSESDDSIQVIDVFSNPGSKKGDNYLCDMIRITAEFSREQNGRKIMEKKSIIFKVSPTFGSVRYNIVS